MIYFMQHQETKLIKIGLTIDLAQRHYVLEGKYGKLYILGVLEGGQMYEWWHHCCFRHANVRGVLEGVEWFEPVHELLWHIHAHTELPVFFEPEVLQALEQYATRNGVDINTAVNNILKQHIELIYTGQS